MNDIGKFHRTSFDGVKDITKTRKLHKLKPFKYTSIITIIFLVYFLYDHSKIFDGLKFISELAISSFPNLLGFTLAGFTVVVAFPNSELLERETKEDTYSIYQILNSFFTINIFIQVLVIGISFIVTWIIKTEISLDLIEKLNPDFKYTIKYIINFSILSVLLFFSVYSIMLLPYIAVNLFSLSQVNNLHMTIRKFIINKKDSNSTDNTSE